MKTVMFNPYTGTPRHPSDIASDPSGLLILEPGAPLRAATHWRAAYSECAAACDAIAEQYDDGRGGHAALRCANVIRAAAPADSDADDPKIVADAASHLIAAFNAAPSVAPEPPTREVLAEIVRSHLTSTYHCTRVWAAWYIGTMTEDDFEPASESDMAEDIADAILAAHPPRAPLSPWQTMKTAPKDGTAVLVLLDASDIPHAARWLSGPDDRRATEETTTAGWHLTWDGSPIAEHDGPRYWMHCPDDPDEAAHGINAKGEKT